MYVSQTFQKTVFLGKNIYIFDEKKIAVITNVIILIPPPSSRTRKIFTVKVFLRRKTL